VAERVRVVGVAALEGAPEGFGGQQCAIFAKGAEQDAVQQLLNAERDFLRQTNYVRQPRPHKIDRWPIQVSDTVVLPRRSFYR
jgi:hypothetical protein